MSNQYDSDPTPWYLEVLGTLCQFFLVFFGYLFYQLFMAFFNTNSGGD